MSCEALCHFNVSYLRVPAPVPVCGGGQPHTRPGARADGRQAALAHLHGPQRAGPPPVARVDLLERRRGTEVVPALVVHEQPRLGPGEVRELYGCRTEVVPALVVHEQPRLGPGEVRELYGRRAEVVPALVVHEQPRLGPGEVRELYGRGTEVVPALVVHEQPRLGPGEVRELYGRRAEVVPALVVHEQPRLGPGEGRARLGAGQDYQSVSGRIRVRLGPQTAGPVGAMRCIYP